MGLPVTLLIVTEYPRRITPGGPSATSCACSESSLSPLARSRRVPELASLLRHTPLVATFDDNDCGGVDADTEARAAARQAFVEHRAMRSFGEGGRGIYRSLRYGPIELFLIDTRSFAGDLHWSTNCPATCCVGARRLR